MKHENNKSLIFMVTTESIGINTTQGSQIMKSLAFLKNKLLLL